jgi:hypothetical protein
MGSDIQNRAVELRDQGCRPAYAIGYAAITDPARATDLHLCRGPQRSGTIPYLIDLDSHSKERNADAAKAGFEAERPELAAKLICIFRREILAGVRASRVISNLLPATCTMPLESRGDMQPSPSSFFEK